MRSPLESRMKIKVIANRDNGFEESYKFYAMEKSYFRLTEEIGMNSEYYSDDDAASQLQDQVREEYNSISEQTRSDSESTMNDEEYDELFKSI
jgi:hypothetical protein